MEKHRKQAVIISTIGVVMILFGVTYSFFNYTRTGVSNTIKVGRISFESEQTNTITLVDVFPIDKTTVNSSNDVGTATITIEGDTTYDDGVEYQLTVSNLTNTVGNKEIPIDVVVTASGIGDSEDDYFNERGGNSSIYKVLTEGTIKNNKQLLVGYIPKGSTGVDGTVTIKAYLDKEKVAISDTYYENVTATPTPTAPNDMYGTTTEWVDDRLVLTTQEWNNLHTNGVSFQVKVEANEGIWVRNPIVCIRATQLHTENCTNQNNELSYNCIHDGYSLNGEISYGNLGTSGNKPSVGDAFDCDVDGTGYNQRFYFVSDYFDTTTKSFDDSTAALIYYSSTYDDGNSNNIVNNEDGVYYMSYDDTRVLYDSPQYVSVQNYWGPVTVMKYLPSATKWNNVELKHSERAILGEHYSNHNTPTTASGAYTLPTNFAYTAKSSRLLSAQELMHGCSLNSLGNFITGEIDNCKFLLENTAYATNGKLYGFWIENPRASNSNMAWFINGVSRNVGSIDIDRANYGARPVIDVPYDKIEY